MAPEGESGALVVELKGEDARLGSVRAADVANLILATERAVARAAGAARHRPVAATARRQRPIAEVASLRLVGIVEGASIDIALALPHVRPDDGALDFDPQHLADEAVQLLSRTAGGEDVPGLPEVLSAVVGLAADAGVGRTARWRCPTGVPARPER